MGGVRERGGKRKREGVGGGRERGGKRKREGGGGWG